MPTNTLLTPDMITRETLFILKNNCRAVALVYKGWQDEFGRAGNKIGATLRVRKPARFVGGDGAAYEPEALTDDYVNVTMANWSKVHFEFDSSELYLSLDDFSQRYLKPAAIALGNKLDRALLAEMYKTTYNAVGVPGVLPDELRTYLQAGQKLDENGCPVDDERYCIINAAERVEIVDALKGLFQDSAEVARQYRTGRMGRTAGLVWYEDENVVRHTVGSYSGTPLVAGASQTGASLATDGWTASTSTLNRGDIIMLAGVYSVNPQNRESTGYLQQFVVTEAVTSDVSGLKTIKISPSIVASGQFQNVTNSPANDAVITVYGNAGAISPQGIVFHNTSHTFLSAPMDMPRGVDMASTQRDPDTGITLRFIRQYVGTPTDMWINRLDVLWGTAPIYPELACRVCG